MRIVRKFIDTSVAVVGYVRRNRKVRVDRTESGGKKCVNLGCGLAVAPGWINVDASLNALVAGSPSWIINLLYRLSGANRYYSNDEYRSILSDNIFVFHDLSRSLPFESETIDYVYSSHFFEHLFKSDLVRLLSEIHGALKMGGVVRIAIPDLEYAISQYHSGNKTEMLDNYFFVNDLESYLARHKYMYDFELISNLLSEAGFKNIRRCEYQSGDVPNLDVLDNRPEETLFVEAVR